MCIVLLIRLQAGINTPDRALKDLSVDTWHNVIDINVNGTFHLVHAVLPVVRDRTCPPFNKMPATALQFFAFTCPPMPPDSA